MRTRNHVKKTLAIITSAIGVLSMALVAAPTATAAPNGNIVAIGDSFTANPDQFRNAVRDIPGSVDGYPRKGGRLQSPDNWPRQMASRHKLSVTDWSCASLTSGGMLPRIDRAITAGDLHAGTRSVVLAVGKNNYSPFTAPTDDSLLNPAAVRTSHLADVRAAARKIRSVAPNTKIIISGALPMVDRTTMMFCAVNVVPNVPAGLPVPVLRDVENWNRCNQKEAARQIGGHYVEMIDGARGHDTCASDRDPSVSGIIDTTTPRYNMAFHPSYAGSRYIVSQLVSVV